MSVTPAVEPICSTTERAPAGSGRSRLPWLFALMAVLVAAVRLYRSPWSASALTIVPDSVEYAVGAQRFATLGRCDLEIEGVAYPLRYPPWFSVVALAPAYAISPSELGAGIVPVLVFALAGVLAAWSIGRRLAGEWGGAAAAALLASVAAYGSLAREIMTDVPAAALALLACRLYLAMRDGAMRDGAMREEEPSWKSWTLAGVLVAAATALRMEATMLALPFLVLAARRAGRWRSISLVLLPLALLLGATAIYQQNAFGDWRRNGYLLWCPVPYDYPSLVFSLDYLGENLRVFLHRWLLPCAVFGAIGTAVLLARRSFPAKGLLVFGALGALPATLAHLFYFFPGQRFHLPLIVLACTIGGAGTAALVPEAVRSRWKLAPSLLVLVPLALPRFVDPPPNRRTVAEMLARWTPDDAVIVTGNDPVYLEPLVLRGTRRRLVPVSRDVEYASKAIAWKRIEGFEPPALDAVDHRAPELFRGGARDVVAFTADEKPEQLAEWVREGVPVFVDRSVLPRKFPAERARELGLELVKESPDRPWLWKLVAIP